MVYIQIIWILKQVAGDKVSTYCNRHDVQKKKKILIWKSHFIYMIYNWRMYFYMLFIDELLPESNNA